jgi:integrase
MSSVLTADPKITCANCKTEIRLTESLAAPLLAATRQQYEQQLLQKDEEVATREQGVREKEKQLLDARRTLDDQIANQVSAQLGTERERVIHDFVFFKEDGEPILSLKYPYMRWRYAAEKLGLRYRDPYTARHSCVSWHLMIGKNLMWCARQHGHSVQVMLSNYGTWIENATEADVEAIKRSLVAEATGAKKVATMATTQAPSVTPYVPWICQ